MTSETIGKVHVVNKDNPRIGDHSVDVAGMKLWLENEPGYQADLLFPQTLVAAIWVHIGWNPSTDTLHWYEYPKEQQP